MPYPPTERSDERAREGTSVHPHVALRRQGRNANDWREARAFERQVHGYRFALSKSKTNPDGALMAPQYTAEIMEDGLTVRLCSVNNTRRAQLASKVARQQREQFKVAGIAFTFYAPLSDEPKQ